MLPKIIFCDGAKYATYKQLSFIGAKYDAQNTFFTLVLKYAAIKF
jgi:hypothetical protein